jgi:hypothetical protein
VVRNYKDYLFENEINVKEVKMFFSPKLTQIFKSINSPISRELLSLTESEDEKFTFSYIDLTKDVDTLSYLPANRLNRIEGLGEKDLINPSPESPAWGEYGRQPIKIGGFVARTLPRYAGTSELEKFGNSFKGILDQDNYRMVLVDGENIRKYYHIKSYYNPNPGVIDAPPEGQADIRTVLMKSCMKQPEKQDFFDIYVNNPDNVKMLVMLNKNNLLVARALVWMDVYVVDKPENPTKGTFLDRIYYTKESDVNIFINYAKEKNWFCKTHQTKDCTTFWFKDEIMDKPITTRLKHAGDYPKYPYLDTLCYYTPFTGRLSSSRGKPTNNPKTGEPLERLQLQKIGGGFKRLSHNK